MNEAKTLKRNILYNTVGNIIYFACQWLVTGFFVKRLSEGSVGDYNSGLLATAMTVTNVFLTLASYGMRTYQVSDADGKYSNADYLLSRILTVAAAVVLCAGYSVAMGYAGAQLVCIFLFLIYKLLEAVTDVFHGFCQKSERMDIIGISYAARGVISVAAFCAVFGFTGDLNLAVGVMAAACYAFSIIFDVVGTRGLYAPLGRFKIKPTAALLLECLPLAAYVFLNTATASIPKLYFERMQGTADMGIYNLVNSPVLILQVGVAFLFTPFITTFTARLKEKNRKGFLSLSAYITGGIFAVGAVGIAGVLLIGKWGLGFLYGADIAIYSGLLVPMVVCTVFTSLVLFYCMLLTVLRDMRGLILSTLAGIAVSLAVSRPLIAEKQFYGTTYATIIALAVESIALAAFGMAKLKAIKAADKTEK